MIKIEEFFLTKYTYHNECKRHEPGHGLYPGGQVHISKVELGVKLMFIFNNNNISSLVSLERFDLKINNLILFSMGHKSLKINK